MDCLTSRWLKECVQLTIFNLNDDDEVANLAIDGSLVRLPLNLFIQTQVSHFLFEFKTLDPNFAESLQSLNLRDVPAGN